MRTTAISSILMGIICCVSMAQLCMPALARLLSLSLTDSILK